MIIKWYKEEKIRWHMGFESMGKFFINKLIDKIYKTGYRDGMTASQWLAYFSERKDNNGRKILFIDEVKKK